MNFTFHFWVKCGEMSKEVLLLKYEFGDSKIEKAWLQKLLYLRAILSFLSNNSLGPSHQGVLCCHLAFPVWLRQWRLVQSWKICSDAQWNRYDLTRIISCFGDTSCNFCFMWDHRSLEWSLPGYKGTSYKDFCVVSSVCSIVSAPISV